MEPVKRDSHNFTYAGPTPEVGDLSGLKAEGQFISHWRPNSEEVALLLEGGDIELVIHAEPIPPVAVSAIGPESTPMPSDPSMEVVTINGQEFRVPPAVAQEIEDLRQGIGDKLITFKPREGETIVITVPDTVGAEMTEAIMHAAAKHFPDSRVAVLPESLGLHRRENFIEAVQIGSRMAELILEPADATSVTERVDLAHDWNKKIGVE